MSSLTVYLRCFATVLCRQGVIARENSRAGRIRHFPDIWGVLKLIGRCHYFSKKAVAIVVALRGEFWKVGINDHELVETNQKECE